MEAFFNFFDGQALAFLGSAIAVAMCCVGSAKGTGMAGEAATGVVSESPENFSKCLILQVLPGTQGLYGLVAWFFALLKLGFFAGAIDFNLSLQLGLMYFAACLPMALGGLLSAMAQGRCAADGAKLVAKRPEQLSKAIIMAIMVEFYAILSLLATFLMLNGL